VGNKVVNNDFPDTPNVKYIQQQFFIQPNENRPASVNLCVIPKAPERKAGHAESASDEHVHADTKM
jgi:hypothetical protein